MSGWFAAAIGGTIGGFLVGLYHVRQLRLMLMHVAASTNGLIAHHDEVVRGLIERIHQLEEEKRETEAQEHEGREGGGRPAGLPPGDA